ncbi:MAG: hypothetical protein C4B58_11895 [Deltaproteobacteria bacterium]|nr:MAG: hypothetical protein C4B58_11895 [Deltaproteobacteria bacterium]
MKKKRILNNPKGAVAVIFVLLLVVLIGFTALGFDAGRWYAAKAKAQEACDAAVLAGMQAYGIPNWKSLAEDVVRENFPQGYLGFYRDTNGVDIVDKSSPGIPRIEGTIRASAETFFGDFIGINTADVCVSCAAGRAPLEIMLILDRSDSIGTSLNNLKNAAISFVNHFEKTQKVDKMGLIIFSTGVQVPFDLQNNFIDEGICTAINGITLGTNGNVDTNMEDALDQADDDKKRNGDDTTTFTKYAWDVPQSKRAKQFLIFLTDGRPCAFRGPFTRNGITYDGVIPDPVNYLTWGEYGMNEGQGQVDVCPGLDGSPYFSHGNEVRNRGWLHDPYTGENKVMNYIDIDPYTGERVFYPDVNGTFVCFGPTGDGLPKDGLPEDELTQCKWDCSATNDPNNPAYHVTGKPEYELHYENTRWHVFDPLWNDEYSEYEDDYSIDDYCSSPGWCLGGLPPNCCDPPYCDIKTWQLGDFYVANRHDPSLAVAGKMTLYHARKLKEEGIIIYCIGLGTVNSGFLKKIPNTDDQYKECPDDDLTTIFNEIADSIKKQVNLL